jgi:hypothetical protein
MSERERFRAACHSPGIALPIRSAIAWLADREHGTAFL